MAKKGIFMKRSYAKNSIYADNFKILIVAAILIAAVNAYGYEDGDFQIWETSGEEIKIGNSAKFTMEQEFRFGEDATEFFYQHYDWGFAWAFDKALEIALGYRLIYEKYKHKWLEEDAPYTNITGKLDLWKFKLEDRNRIEYRHFRFKDDSMRYRNKFAIRYPFDFHAIKVTPYVANEIFVSSNGTGFNQNRLQPGVEFGLTKYVKADISYIWQSIKLKDYKWAEVNVLAAKIKTAF